jgi:streptogramin lyase
MMGARGNRSSGLGARCVRPLVGCRRRPHRLSLALLSTMIAFAAWLAVAASATAGSTEVDEFSLPSGNQPVAITRGPDGNLWFTESTAWFANGTAIGRITPAGEIAEFPGAHPSSSFQAIVAGPDGNLWFTENAAIGRITTSGSISTFAVPNGFKPAAITAGSDGNLWFTDSGGSSGIGRITPAGQVTIFSGPGEGRQPHELAAGPDGNVWFTEQQSGGASRIGRINPAGEITEFSVGGPTAGIALGPEGNMWFTGGERIGRITPDGRVREFALPSRSSVGTSAGQIVTGPDDNMWFAGYSGSHPGSPYIGRVTPQGVGTGFSAGAAGVVPSIAVGTENNLWFVVGPRGYPAESGGRAIGQMPIPHASGVTEILDGGSMVQRRWVKLRIKCKGSDWNSACAGNLVLSVKARRRNGRGGYRQPRVVVIARTAYKLPVSGSRVVRLRLTRAALGIFARHTHLRVDASANAFDLVSSTTRNVVLRRSGRPLLPR